MPGTKSVVTAKIDDLTATLESKRRKAMEAAGYDRFENRDVMSFHAVMGSKNNLYVDSIRQVFLSPQQFISEWKAGALRVATEKDEKNLRLYKKRYQNSAVHRIIAMLQDPTICEYIEIFHERNFYRQYNERIRTKPEDALWELWFGPKNQEYGLFITPRYRNDVWENDVSEIRRVPFEYWTIGHVLHSGFIDPNRDTVFQVDSIDALFSLFQSVFVRSAGSVYSSRFAQEYEAYVKASADAESIPFLIPEFRFLGTQVDHKHRLDFTILSARNNHKIGIELSPWSTHGRVVGKKKLEKQGEGAVEAARIAKWEADTAKRNNYFTQYGITTLTFTDSQLADIPGCFKTVKKYLKPSKEQKIAIPATAQAINSYTFDGSA